MGEKPVDWQGLIAAMDDDEELARELAILFADGADAMLADIAQAIEQKNLDALRKKAHEIKGSSANMQALSLTDLAARLESAAREGDDGMISSLANQLEAEMNVTVEFLRKQAAS